MERLDSSVLLTPRLCEGCKPSHRPTTPDGHELTPHEDNRWAPHLQRRHGAA